MELIFDFEDYTILPDLLPFLSADFVPDKLKQDIRMATREIIKLVGQDTYDLAVAAYNNEDPGDGDTELLLMFRHPIALYAYRQYAPSSDLIHTNDGRKIRAEDNEKPSFDWMLDRNNDQLERKYYMAVDALLDFLEDQPVWKASEEYAHMHSTIVSDTATLTRFYPKGNRLLLMMMAPGMLDFQLTVLLARFGSEHMTTLIAGQNLTPEDTALLTKCREASVYHGIAWALRAYQVTIFPEGILQSYRGDRNATRSRGIPQKNEVAATVQFFEEARDRALGAIDHLLAPVDRERSITAGTHKGYTANDDDKFVST